MKPEEVKKKSPAASSNGSCREQYAHALEEQVIKDEIVSNVLARKKGFSDLMDFFKEL